MYFNLNNGQFCADESVSSSKEEREEEGVYPYVDNGIHPDRPEATVKGHCYEFGGEAVQGYLTPAEFLILKDREVESWRNRYRTKIDNLVKEDVQKMAFGDISELPASVVAERVNLKAAFSAVEIKINACVSVFELYSPH